MKNFWNYLIYVLHKFDHDPATKAMFDALDRNKPLFSPFPWSIVDAVLFYNKLAGPHLLLILTMIVGYSWYKAINNFVDTMRWFVAEWKFFNKSKS